MAMGRQTIGPADFAARFSAVVTASGLSFRKIEARSGVGRSAVNAWARGTSLPQSDVEFVAVVRVCARAAENRGNGLRTALRSEREWRALLAAAKQTRDSRAVLPHPQPSASRTRHPNVIVSRPAADQPRAEGTVPLTRRLPPVWNVPRRNPFFTGRDEALTEIERRLRHHHGTAAIGVVTLGGMGGMGKSQTAVEYAHRHAADFHLVWWVNADSPILATAGLTDLARELALPTDGPPRTVLRRLWTVLDERDDWLLIYDNVDDPAALADLRPPGSGRLLLTGRSPVIGRFSTPVEIGVFTRAESVLLLLQRCPGLPPQDADRVADALGDLPIAVEQAGCFLAETGLDVEDYLGLLTDQPAAAGLSDPTLDRHPGLAAVVATSWARTDAVSAQAASLLDQLAFLAPEPLPLAPIPSGTSTTRFGVQVGDACTTATLVRQVSAMGLVRHVGTTLWVHRLVQALLRARMAPEQQARSRRDAQQLLGTAVPGDPENPACWPAYATLSPHIQALADAPAAHNDSTPEPDQFRVLLLNLARYLYVSCHYVAAQRLASHAHVRWSRILGPDHRDTLDCASRLADPLFGLGAYAAALGLLEDTLARSRRALGENDPDTLASAHSLAAAYDDLGRHAAARDVLEDTFGQQRRTLGEDHPATLRSAISLAAALHDLGEHTAARDLQEDTLGRLRQTLGRDHPDTLRAAKSLAYTLYGLGSHQVARDLHDDTLARQRRVLGDHHLHALSSASGLAIARTGLSQYAAARDLLEHTYTNNWRSLGKDHPETLRSAHDLATALYALGDYSAARDLFQETLARRHRVLGQDHTDTHQTAKRLAQLPPCATTLADTERRDGTRGSDSSG
jgi:tetratricopeptide (TPR) repeat protein